MIDAAKAAPTTAAPTPAGTPPLPAAYSPPAATALGGLEQVQANYAGKYYDGPSTSSWYRY